MNMLTALLVAQQIPFPLPLVSVRKHTTAEIYEEPKDGDKVNCGGCHQEFDVADMHVKRDGKIGAHCKKCTARSIARRNCK